MIDIGNCTFFGHNNNASSVSSIARFIEAYDIIGNNVLYLNYDPKLNKRNNILDYLVKVRTIVIPEFNRIPELLKDELFRVDVILFSLIGHGEPMSFKAVLDIIRTVTDIPVIFIGDIEIYDKLRRYYMFEHSYYFCRKDGSDANQYIIGDINDGWETTLPDLFRQYDRNRKLEQLFNKE